MPGIHIYILELSVQYSADQCCGSGSKLDPNLATSWICISNMDPDKLDKLEAKCERFKTIFFISDNICNPGS